MKQIISTAKAPKAIGPYSQAIRAGQFLFISGQIPVDPQSGEVLKGDIEKATHQVLQNLKAIVEAAQFQWSEVVKTTIYLKDLGNFQKVNQIYATFFTEAPPARATVQVAKLPLDVDIEIDAVCYQG